MWLLARSPPNKPSFMYHGLRSLPHAARISRESEQTLRLRVQQQAHEVDPMWQRITVYEQMEHALREGKVSRVATVFNREGKVSRVATVFNTANGRGFSTARLTAYLEDSVRTN